MSLSNVFYDPFADFDRLFDEAFRARTSGNASGPNNQVQRQGPNGQAGPLRPR